MSDPVAAAIATAGIPVDEPSNVHSTRLPHHAPKLDSSADEDGEDDLVVYTDEEGHDRKGDSSTMPIPTFSLTRASSDERTSTLGKPDHALAGPSHQTGQNDDDNDNEEEDDGLNFDFRSHLLPLTPSRQEDDDYDPEEEEENGKPSGAGRGPGHRIGANERYGEVESSVRAGGSEARRRRGRGGPVGGGPKRAMREHARRVGLIDGIALTVGLQIGSGIFSSPGVVTLNAGSVGASFLVWIMSGILAWTGASSFAELGAAIPLNGGAQAYLNYSFGPLSAYLFAWTAITALKPGSGAIVAMIFGEYVARIIFHVYVPLHSSGSNTAADASPGSDAASAPHEQGLDSVPDWATKLIACGLVVFLTLLNVISAKLALFAIPILAIVQVSRGRAPEASLRAYGSISGLFEGSATSPSAYALALYSGLWSFDGWDQASYVAASFKNPSRDLPRVIHSSLSIVLLVFVAAVASYFAVLPPAQVKRTNTVALDFGSALFGPTGAILFAALVAFSCFGALNGQIFTSGRLVSAASAEGYLPSIFGVYSRRTDTPIAAIVLQSTLTLFFVVFASGFAALINFYAVCSWSFYCLTGLALLTLRVKEPNLERPYRTWIATPILFSTVALFLLFMPIFSAPLEALAAAGFIGAGVPMYYMTQARAREKVPGLRWMYERLGFGRRTSAGVSRVGMGGAGYASLAGQLPSVASGAGAEVMLDEGHMEQWDQGHFQIKQTRAVSNRLKVVLQIVSPVHRQQHAARMAATTSGQYPHQYQQQQQQRSSGGRPLPVPPQGQPQQQQQQQQYYSSNPATEAAWYEHEARFHQPSYIFQPQQQQQQQQHSQFQQYPPHQQPQQWQNSASRPAPQGGAQPYHYPTPQYSNQQAGPPSSYPYHHQQQAQDAFVTANSRFPNPYANRAGSRIVDNENTSTLRVGAAKGSAFMHKGFWDIISLVNNQSGSPSRLLAPPGPSNRFGGSNPSSPSKFKTTLGKATAGLRRVPVPAAPASHAPSYAAQSQAPPAMSEATFDSAYSGPGSPASSHPSEQHNATRVVDAEQAEVILKRWSRDGMGQIADPRWVEPLKEAMRMQAARSQAQAVAEVQAAMHQESVIVDQPRQLEIKNGAPSTTASTMTTSTARGPGGHTGPGSQYYSAMGGTFSPVLMRGANQNPFDNIQEEGGPHVDDITAAVNNLAGLSPRPTSGDAGDEVLMPPRPFQGLGLPRSNTQDTMLVYSPGEAETDSAQGGAGQAAGYMQYRPSGATLTKANVMNARPSSKYDGLPGAAGLPMNTDGRPTTMLIHDMPPPNAPHSAGLPHSQGAAQAQTGYAGDEQAADEQDGNAAFVNMTGTLTASSAPGGLALAIQAAAIRPSLQTIEKSVAAKIYFENLYYSILKKPRARDTRKAGLEAELASLGNRISELEKAAIRAKWMANETEYLREMRARVNVNSFVRLKTIGHGAFGVVALVKERGTGGLFAMKQLRKADMLRKGQEGHVRAERDLMTSASASASARWIVKLVYSFQDVDHLYLIMEFMGGGDLLNLLIEKDIFEEDFARFYVAEMILGIHEAHRFGYIHRDIKPDNFLFTADGHIKLADFGLCQSFHWAHDGAYYDQQRKHLLRKHGIDLDDSHPGAVAGRRRGAAALQAQQKQGGGGGGKPGNGLNEKELGDVMSDRNEDGTPMTHVLTWRDKNKKKIAYSVVGTNNYMAPEVLRGLGYDQGCDWWSLGVIVFEMLYGYPPFVSKSRHLTRQKILNWRQTLKFPPRPKVGRDAHDFISKLICEREDRLGTVGNASVSRPNSIIQRERRSGILGTGPNGAPIANSGLMDGVEDLMAHPWFRNIDWTSLHRQRAPFRPALTHPADTKHFEDDIEAEPLPAPGAGEPGANPNADQPRDPMLRDKEHGKNLLEMRKQLAFVGYTFKAPRDVNFLEESAKGKGKQPTAVNQRGRSQEPTETGSRLRSMSM
ncbi:unnamed protein product [Tilletia controversa]|nr:unnamed protein product [Tilletia controversa]